jgi:hypothetical protein
MIDEIKEVLDDDLKELPQDDTVYQRHVLMVQIIRELKKLNDCMGLPPFIYKGLEDEQATQEWIKDARKTEPT